jgi:hypothetical protein
MIIFVRHWIGLVTIGPTSHRPRGARRDDRHYPPAQSDIT